MKNVTKILGAVVLCTALFASAQRVDALGGSQFWPDDEANIALFPAQMNNHAYVQIDGVGTEDGATDDGNVSVLFQKDGTSWGFTYGGTEWINMGWGDGQQAVTFGFNNYDSGSASGTSMTNGEYSLGYGNTFGFGEVGIHYSGGAEDDASTTNVDESEADLNVFMKPDFGFWLFDHTFVGLVDLTGDMVLHADFYSHMDAGGADVVYGWGLNMNTADNGGMTQTATVGVEANMTDWATFRAGYNWTHSLSNDEAEGVAAPTGMSDGNFMCGLGFNWGGLTADMTVDSGLFQDPIGAVTGYDDGGLTNSTVTLTYSF